MMRAQKTCIEKYRDNIIQMVADGLKVSQIAKKVGATRKGLEQALARWGEYNVSRPAFHEFLQSKDQVIQDKLSGMTRDAIAHKYGVNSSTVTKYMKTWGFPFAVPKEIDREVIINLRNGGLTLKEVAEKSDTSISTVSRVLREEQMTDRRFAKRSKGSSLPPKIVMPELEEGELYRIELDVYTFKHMVRAARPMAVFLDRNGHRITFTDLQLINAKGDVKIAFVEKDVHKKSGDRAV